MGKKKGKGIGKKGREEGRREEREGKGGKKGKGRGKGNQVKKREGGKLVKTLYTPASGYNVGEGRKGKLPAAAAYKADRPGLLWTICPTSFKASL